ncbi:hypothetical protein TeGR_g8714 [Tetraparma gracilis]|uniref:Divinyl chlorophyllide a 8-vinyl-reductase, chloroplastic n=1 Tax=Tetraparma gracilis TaxID=2962635 RepID=A0ABQ6N2Y9_9STRA|nr:hypothetical protein TeGR_g8714 [Tetraparma gracilis]
MPPSALARLILLLSLLLPSSPFHLPSPPPSRSSPLSATHVVAGATGYIGSWVVQECVRQGHETYALARPGAAPSPSVSGRLKGATLLEVDYEDPAALAAALSPLSPSVAISCLASRSGVKADAYKVDYQATSNFLSSSLAAGASHFTLLSAFCVKNPWLHFQQAKLKFEGELEKSGVGSYAIVRPTAFFKSVSAQLEVIQKGAPYVMFGDGEVTSCNPISEPDLAEYLVSCSSTPSRQNKVLNVGGPDSPLTQKELGVMMFKAANKKEFFVSAPLALFDVIIDGLQLLADRFGGDKLQDAAETARIGKYYAVEDMLTTEEAEKFGRIGMMQHFERIAVEGQEYDPYTTVFGKKGGGGGAVEA